jgi:GNAT superfamily N-acetyltransferase
VTVEALDPHTASEADLAACHAVKAAATALDRPDAPTQSAADFHAWLTATHAANRVRLRMVRLEGVVVGLNYLLLPLDANLDMGLFWPWVHPEHRRRGAGAELLADTVDMVRAEGRQLLTVETIQGTAGATFAERRGFRVMQREVLSRLLLSTVDSDALAAVVATEHPGYRLEHWRGPVPERWLEPYARALEGMHDAPLGDLRYERPTYTPEYVRNLERWAAERGVEHRITAAVHDATGEVVGLTLIYIPTGPDTRASQDDTTIVQAHRGHGLGLWIKADMTLRLIADHPNLVDIITGNAEDNTHMRRINTELGFRPVQVSQERQSTVDEVTKILEGSR